MDKIVPFWKPVGLTSFDVVRRVKSKVKPSKVGHAGTLDPFAEGILILCIGKMTRKVESLMDLKKEYIATIKLGETTDTLDTEGKITETSDIPKLSRNEIESILSSFIGEIEQIPPMYSALKKDGVPLYKLARKGIVVERKPRLINIYEIELLSETNEDSISIRVVCGRGTYIRTLADDIAKKIGTVGYLTSLTRTKIGNYCENNAIKLEDIPRWLSSVA
ncbi:MAG: tRNA pseudouridine(55) synthase TruB [Candidatus Marinimicrobia bacterium]|nr:tRNA pseudouridine(55) synthase TruB [Candidatus Neomarinimicrobiota bacterium]MBL7023496.1 tRNA pseudouridine(55) synthase TruB [Candidatus Neomarinimicrobiota bacterium]MBL7109545.1 tRNA pseudouridine(55) synthase TruB [Candidatus Neomarinimicrobiota bacterium]